MRTPSTRPGEEAGGAMTGDEVRRELDRLARKRRRLLAQMRRIVYGPDDPAREESEEAGGDPDER